MKSAPRTGIVAAMHPELAAVLAAMPDERRQPVATRDFLVARNSRTCSSPT